MSSRGKIWSQTTRRICGHVLSRFGVMLLGILAASSSPIAQADDGFVIPTTTVRVDTTKDEVKAVYNLVAEFLNSRPDSVADLSVWSSLERQQYEEPYCARRWVYPSAGIIRSFPPHILSIEPEGDLYCCRILYYAENLQPPYATSNPWALQRLYAGLEDGNWRLFDPLRVRSKTWNRTKNGDVEFVYPCDHTFDAELAEQTVQLIDSLSRELACPVDFPIEFYVTRTLDELNALVGLDFTLNVSAGRALIANHTVLTSTGKEWYPHELVHIVIDTQKVPFILSEGIATLVGGTGEKTFSVLVEELQHVWDRNDSLSVQDFLDQMYQEGSFTHFYAVGAVLCQAAIDTGGSAMLRELLFCGQSDEDFYEAAGRVFGVDRDGLNALVRKKTAEYTRTRH